MESNRSAYNKTESDSGTSGVTSVDGYLDSKKSSRWEEFTDQFRKAPPEGGNETEIRTGYDEEALTDIERINVNTSNTQLKRKLKGRHLQMIAIASSIGTGLFVGTGSALSDGGPGGVLIAWSLIGSAILCTIQAMAELAVTFPISGSFNVYASRFIDPSVGFAVAWNYFFQFLVLLPLELVAGSITIKFWNTSINPDVWVLIFYVLIIVINFLGVRAYGEAEFIFSTIKVIAVIGFIIVSIVLAAGGGPSGNYVGALYWHNPGAFANGFKGVASVFVTAAFSFGGTELVGLTAAESDNPRVSLPKATKQVFWRILMFYMISLTLITFLVPYNSDKLLGASSVDVTASPFVIAIQNGGIKVLPSIMNAVVLICVISVGSSSVYATSRTLTSLAQQGLAPSVCGYIDKKGRPLVAITITNIFGLLSFIAASDKQEEVFNWLLAISALSSIFTWCSINLAHIRFRAALHAKRRGLDQLAFTSQTGVIGSYYGLILNVLVLIAQFWIALFPLGGEPNASDFFASYLGFVVLLVFYIGHKIWKRNWMLYIRADEIDVDSGRQETDLEALKEELDEQKAILRSKPLYYRLYKAWC